MAKMLNFPEQYNVLDDDSVHFIRRDEGVDVVESFIACPSENLEEFPPDEHGDDLHHFGTLEQAEADARERGWPFIYHPTMAEPDGCLSEIIGEEVLRVRELTAPPAL